MLRVILVVGIILLVFTPQGRKTLVFMYGHFVTGSTLPWVIFGGVFLGSYLLGQPSGIRGGATGGYLLILAYLIFHIAPKKEGIKDFIQKYLFDGHDIWASGSAKWYAGLFVLTGLVLLVPAGAIVDQISNVATVVGLLIFFILRREKGRKAEKNDLVAKDENNVTDVEEV